MRRLWTGGPTNIRKAGRDHRLWWVGWDEGIDVVRDAAGNWSELVYPVDEVLTNDYVFVLRGGYRKIVPENYYLELVALGYGEYFENLDEYDNTMLYEYEE
jgi:hypothetical protein